MIEPLLSADYMKVHGSTHLGSRRWRQQHLLAGLSRLLFGTDYDDTITGEGGSYG